VICAYIDAHKHRFGVEPICRVLSEHAMPIAPSSYYAHRRRPVSPALRAEAHLVNTVIDLHREHHGLYGVRKMWHLMTQEGHLVGRDQIARLMTIAGLRGVRRGDHRTTTTRRRAADDRPRPADLINRDWAAPTRPDQWWVADFTYVWTPAGFCYVSFVVDVYSRRILGWRVASSMTTALVAAALDQALFTRRRTDTRFTSTGLVHHSDAGSQGGFNRSSQHLERGGVQGWRRRTGAGRPAMSRRVRVGSGVRIGRYARRCGPLGDLSPRGRCSGSSGV